MAVYFNTRPPKGVGPRTTRELHTLSLVIDFIVTGKVTAAMDVVMPQLVRGARVAVSAAWRSHGGVWFAALVGC